MQGSNIQPMFPAAFIRTFIRKMRCSATWNSEHCRWIEQHDWIYTREFTLTPEDISEEAGIPELLFEGLDTYCEIRLNDVLVGTAENMFIPHRFCVKGRLAPVSTRFVCAFIRRYTP